MQSKNGKTYQERYDDERIQAIASLDKDILEATRLLEQIREQKLSFNAIKRPIPNYLINAELSVMRYRTDIKDRKSRYAMSATPQEAEQEKSEEDAE
jgi:hypothetical protein